MRARLFQSQFATAIRLGQKRQTVRPMPKRMPRIGDYESWRCWTGLPYRSKQHELAQVELTGLQEITITKTQIIIGSKSLSASESNAFAKADGFKSLFSLFEWFEKNHSLPFNAILITAKDLAQLSNSHREE